MPAGADPLVSTFIAFIPPFLRRIRCGFLQLTRYILLPVRVCHVQVPWSRFGLLARGMVWVTELGEKLAAHREEDMAGSDPAQADRLAQWVLPIAF